MADLENVKIVPGNDMHFRIAVRCQRCRTYGDDLNKPDAWDSLAAIFYVMSRKRWFWVVMTVGFIAPSLALPFVSYELCRDGHLVYLYFPVIVTVIVIITSCCFLQRGRCLASEYSLEADFKKLPDMQSLLAEDPV